MKRTNSRDEENTEKRQTHCPHRETRQRQREGRRRRIQRPDRDKTKTRRQKEGD
jgi:hypothetical protein